MVAMTGSFSTAAPSRSRVLIHSEASLAQEDWLTALLRSLQLEHIDPALETARETPRTAPRSPQRVLEVRLAAFRRRMQIRRKGRGFALTGFPGNTHEARCLDEWLDDQGEVLDVCFYFPRAGGASRSTCDLMDYFRQTGRILVPSQPDAEALQEALQQWEVAA